MGDRVFIVEVALQCVKRYSKKKLNSDSVSLCLYLTCALVLIPKTSCAIKRPSCRPVDKVSLGKQNCKGGCEPDF